MMKNLSLFATGLAVTCLTSLPAFADPLSGLLSTLFGSSQTAAPCGAPAPLLAAGIPAFVALGGGALVAKILAPRNAPTA